MEEKAFVIQRGILDNRKRQLILHPDFLKFQTKEKSGNAFTTLQKEDIAAFNFGINWMRYKFVFGREYVINILTHDNKIVKLNFKTYFGSRKKEFTELWNNIINVLWQYYFYDISNDLINKGLQEGFNIGEVSFTTDGLFIVSTSSLVKKRVFIKWDDVGIKDYASYFAVYDKNNAVDVNRGYSYFYDWNTEILNKVLHHYLKEKQIKQ